VWLSLHGKEKNSFLQFRASHPFVEIQQHSTATDFESKINFRS
jgi:hypothetical protein